MKNNPIRILINEKDANKRLDVVLAEKLREYTRSNLKNGYYNGAPGRI